MANALCLHYLKEVKAIWDLTSSVVLTNSTGVWFQAEDKGRSLKEVKAGGQTFGLSLGGIYLVRMAEDQLLIYSLCFDLSPPKLHTYSKYARSASLLMGLTEALQPSMGLVGKGLLYHLNASQVWAPKSRYGDGI